MFAENFFKELAISTQNHSHLCDVNMIIKLVLQTIANFWQKIFEKIDENSDLSIGPKTTGLGLPWPSGQFVYIVKILSSL
jgi:hypothetical protein